MLYSNPLELVLESHLKYYLKQLNQLLSSKVDRYLIDLSMNSENLFHQVSQMIQLVNLLNECEILFIFIQLLKHKILKIIRCIIKNTKIKIN
jgi:hypothetical protein